MDLAAVSRSSVRQSLCFSQHFDCLFHRQQDYSLRRAKRAARRNPNRESRSRNIVWSFDQQKSVLLTETIPEAMQLSAKFFHDTSRDLAAILRLLDEPGPSFGCVTE